VSYEKPESSGSNTGSDTTPADEGPYKFAIGKYDTDAEGWPLEKYEYELPLSTTDETFTNMTLSFLPQYLPEDGFAELPMYMGREDKTGVHMEYMLISTAAYQETLSTQEATDDLPDIIAGFWAYHSGATLAECIDDGIIVNIYDYKAYAPNYCRWYKDFEWIDNMKGNVNLPTETKWIAMVDFYDEPCQTTGYFMRGDWLDELGLAAYDANTYDDWYDQLMAMKVAGYCEFPLQVYSYIDAYGNVWNGFNTAPYTESCMYLRVIDGEVSMTGMTEDCLVLSQYLNKWYNDGILSPNFQAMRDMDAITLDTVNNGNGCSFYNPSEIAGIEAQCIDPDARFDVMKKLVCNEGDILHWHLDPDEFGGTGSSVAGSCDNIELVITWLDWAYSPAGVEWTNYGPQGVYWDYDEGGNRYWLDIMTSFEWGIGWAVMEYLQSPMDSGVNSFTRNYINPESRRLWSFFEVWNECLDYYDGAYNYPGSLHLDDDAAREVNQLRTDADTFFAENYVQFILGNKSYSEWDAFQSQLRDMGMARVVQIYQEAYDEYMAA